MTKRKEATRTMTEAEFLASLGPGEPLKVLQARQAEDVAWAMAHENEPLEGAIRIRIVPGRPPKGEEAPVTPKVLKMPPAFWDEMAKLASGDGLSLHAAMRQAVLKWAKEHQHSKAG